MTQGEDNVSQNSVDTGSQYSCNVECLDGNTVNFAINKHAKASELFDKVFDRLKIHEKEYFGLHFVEDDAVHMWLNKNKSMKHQLKGSAVTFKLRIRFYEPEPTRLHAEYTRYLLYLQLREDIVEGRIACNESTYVLLGSYTIQAELGDYDPQHLMAVDNYVFSPDQTRALINKVTELYKEHRGQTPAQAELNFLDVAKKLKYYGLDIHDAQDVEGPVKIGAGAIGIFIYRNEKREFLYKWPAVSEVLYNRRRFTIKLKKNSVTDGMKSMYVYYFQSAKRCKQCYKSCIECHAFFRLSEPDTPIRKRDSLHFGSSFRYSDRTLYMLRQTSTKNPRKSKFTRTPSMRKSEISSVPATATQRKELIDDEKEPLLTSVDGKIKVKDEKEEKASMTPSIQYEEIEIDENYPDDENFDPEEWSVEERILGDGTKKRYRCRVLQISLHSQELPAKKEHPKKQDFPMEEKVEVHREEKAPEVFMESVVVPLEEKPSLSNRSPSPVAKEMQSSSSMDDNMDKLLMDLSFISQSLVDEEVNINRKPAELQPKITHAVEEDIQIEETALEECTPEKIVFEDTSSEREEEIDDARSKRLSMAEEKRLHDDLNATIESIFQLQEDEYQIPPKYNEVYVKDEFEIVPSTEVHQFEMPPEVESRDDLVFEKEESDDTENINLESKEVSTLCEIPPSETKVLEVVQFESVCEDGDAICADETNKAIDAEENSHVVVSNVENVIVDADELLYVDLKDVIYVNVDESDIRSASLLRQKKEDYEYEQVPGEVFTSHATYEEEDTVVVETHIETRHHMVAHSEIIYTLTDVSSVEQGGSGFVQALKAKHEDIAKTEGEKKRRESDSVAPKGHVPTRTVSFNAKERIIPTRTPPAVAAKPTFIVPASSELPDEEVTFESNQSSDEFIQSTDSVVNIQQLPDVATQVVTFDEDTSPGTVIISTSESLTNEASQVLHIFGETENFEEHTDNQPQSMNFNHFETVETNVTIQTSTVSVSSDSEESRDDNECESQQQANVGEELQDRLDEEHEE